MKIKFRTLEDFDLLTISFYADCLLATGCALENLGYNVNLEKLATMYEIDTARNNGR